jgi:hypothetical protein
MIDAAVDVALLFDLGGALEPGERTSSTITLLPCLAVAATACRMPRMAHSRIGPVLSRHRRPAVGTPVLPDPAEALPTAAQEAGAQPASCPAAIDSGQ